ncbi:MAG: hypothetical protein IKJ29_00895 [Akkermansia sp.]|nr:hypothetical protein [Akkermansia sp.]
MRETQGQLKRLPHCDVRISLGRGWAFALPGSNWLPSCGFISDSSRISGAGGAGNLPTTLCLCSHPDRATTAARG